MNRRHCLSTSIAFALSGSAAFAADTFPSKPISIYVPYAAGGSVDASTRALARAAEKPLGVPLLIVNKPGAGGAIAAGTVAKSPADGYSLAVVAPSNLTITPQLQKVPYDPLHDFTPVMGFGETTIYLVVRGDSGFNTLEQLLAHAKQKPGEIITAITAIGAGTHLSTARLMQERGVQMDYVTFGGGAQIVSALRGGHVQMAVLAGEALPFILNGDLKVLASFSRTQLPALKNVRSIQQSGSTWEPNSWIALAGPAKLPEPIRLRLEQAFLTASQDETFRKVLEELAMLPKPLTGQQLGVAIQDAYAENARLTRAVGLVK